MTDTLVQHPKALYSCFTGFLREFCEFPLSIVKPSIAVKGQLVLEIIPVNLQLYPTSTPFFGGGVSLRKEITLNSRLFVPDSVHMLYF